jgi:hypothetical protein
MLLVQGVKCRGLGGSGLVVLHIWVWSVVFDELDVDV